MITLLFSKLHKKQCNYIPSTFIIELKHISNYTNTAALFYYKIRLAIEQYLAFEANKVFEGKIEINERYFGGHRNGRVSYEQQYLDD